MVKKNNLFLFLCILLFIFISSIYTFPTKTILGLVSTSFVITLQKVGSDIMNQSDILQPFFSTEQNNKIQQKTSVDYMYSFTKGLSDISIGTNKAKNDLLAFLKKYK